MRKTRRSCSMRSRAWASGSSGIPTAPRLCTASADIFRSSRPSCAWAMPAPRSGRSPRCSRSPGANTSSRVPRVCTSGRSAIWSTRCGASAPLMALPLADSAASVEVEGELVSKPYVEITVNLMRRFGVGVAQEGWSSFVVPRASYSTPGEIHVEGDASSASYFLAAGAISGLSGGGPVRVEGVGRASIQGDVQFARVLERMGAAISMGEDWIESSAGPQARARGKLKALDADLNHIPDAAMTAAVVALFAGGPSTLRNIAGWRVKETDRLAAVAAELRKLGAAVEEGNDSIRVTPPAALKPATIATYDDHRMAMSFSLAALGGIKVRINDPGCVGKTFPEYFEVLASVSRRAA